jgi:FkbM family methyltransferase
MSPALFEDLRFQGYNPRTLLDIGAHLGAFSVQFLQTFPDCIPTLVEPNPHCQDDLAGLSFERHAFAASDRPGRGEMFLSREWLQSTGSSLYRETTAFFRDEVLLRAEVDKARIDDVFAGRTFDFVKIDTQGAELDVLTGGRAVLSKADYILVEVSFVEYNAGGAKAEAVFATLADMGFRCRDAAEFHRLRGVENGALIQMDFLFERCVQRPTQNIRYAALNGHAPLLDWLKARKSACPDFRVINVGAATEPWSGAVLDATIDISPRADAPLHFTGNLNDPRSWDEVLRHVSRHGRFAYAICSHTLADLAYPAMVLEMLPRIADAGYIAVPSRFLEALRPEGPYRGFIHHRWILDSVDGELVIAPKIGLLEYLSLNGEGDWAAAPDRYEFQMIWRRAIAFSSLNGDYLGPSREAVIAYYAKFLDRN